MITGKIVSLKDKQSGSIFPQTSSEAVYMNDGKTLEEISQKSLFFSEDTDTVQIQRPDMIEKVNTLEKVTQYVSSTLISTDINTFVSEINKIKDGGTLILPKNSILEIESSIILENLKNVTIKGSGNNIIRIKNNQKITGIELLNCNGVIFENITFDGNNFLQNITDFGNYMIINGTNSVNLTIDKCIFINVGDVCILDRNQDINTVTNVPVKIANTIITNCRFFNCKHSYLTKGGGSKNIIYTNNIHKDCYTGIKIDGEVINNLVQDTTNGNCGNVIISNNIFNNIGGTLCNGAGLNCIMVEEAVSNVNICDNLIENINYVNGIAFNTGQTCKFTQNINVSNNIIKGVRNAHAIFIGEWAFHESNTSVIHSNYVINNNMIDDVDFSGIQLLLPNVPLDRIVIKNNNLSGCCKVGYSGVVRLNGTKIRFAEISNNTFFVDITVPETRQIYVTDNLSSNKLIIKSNTIKCSKTGTGNNDFVETITIEKSINTIIYNNIIERSVLNIFRSVVDISSNKLNESVIRLNALDSSPCISTVINNIFIQNETTSAYYLRIGDGGTGHKVINNIYSSSYVTPIYAASGSYTETL